MMRGYKKYGRAPDWNNTQATETIIPSSGSTEMKRCPYYPDK